MGATIYTTTSIEELDLSRLQHGMSVICLSEVDKPLLSDDITPKALENLQELLGASKDLLWVTCGRLSSNPRSNMMVGIGRAMAFELPHVRMQFLDFDQENQCDARTILQYLFQMILSSSPEFAKHKPLWVQEPEITLNGDAVLIPRIVRDDESNEYLNANQRRITRLATSVDKIEVDYTYQQPLLVEKHNSCIPMNLCTIEVALSTPLNLQNGNPYFLCLGKLNATGKLVLAVSESDSLVVVMDQNRVFEIPDSMNIEGHHMLAIATALVAYSIFTQCSIGDTLLLYQPPTRIVKVFDSVAELTQRRVLFAADYATPRQDWIYVHPLTSTRALQRSMPKKVTVAWALDGEIPTNLICALPAGCVTRTLGECMIACDQALIARLYDLSMQASLTIPPEVIKLSGSTISGSIRRPFTSILDWRAGPVEVALPSSNGRQLFSASKTYLLMGMTGELGQSLCRFMIDAGARHVVLASRSPDFGEHWSESMNRAEVNIQIHRVDVTNRFQVHRLALAIRETMPSIGGIMNAALVLEDSMFVNVTVDNIHKQLGPKVQGTEYLNDEFSYDDLDFFIAFSSLGSVYGNAGQSIYHAANMFLSGFIEQRRRRGLVGSVINIGMLVDVGYVAKKVREGAKLDQHLHSQLYAPLSESDFHHLIAQAIISGHPQSGNGELTMGIEQIFDAPGAAINTPWYENPRFSHITSRPAHVTKPTQVRDAAKQPRYTLEQASTAIEITETIQKLLLQKLEIMLRVPADSIDIEVPLADLGLDSLLAVEIRAWLMKELHVDIAVFQILSRDPMKLVIYSIATKYYCSKFPNTTTAETTPSNVGEEFNTLSAVAHLDLHGKAEYLEDFKGQNDPPYPGSDINLIEEVSSPVAETSSGSSTPIDPTPPSPHSQLSPRPGTPSSLLEITGEDVDELSEPIEFRYTGRASFSQASLHFIQGLLDDPTTFNVVAKYDIKGQLNTRRLSRALEGVLSHHDAYRTCFFIAPGCPTLTQAVLPEIRGNRLVHKHSNVPEEVEQCFQALANHRWNLSSGYLMQAVLFTRGTNSHTLLIGCHHIIMDGMSWHIFLRDLELAYQMQSLPPVSKTYCDFSRQQIESLHQSPFCQSLDYWVRTLKPSPSILPLLPTAQRKDRKTQRRYRNHTVQTEIDAATMKKIQAVSRAQRSSPMHFCLSVIVSFFARIMGLEDICIGVTDTGRVDRDFHNTIGHFVNILPLRLKMHAEQTFDHILEHTSHVVLDGLNHSQVPIDLILEKLGLERSSSETPLFQLAFNYRTGDLIHRTLGNCSMDLTAYVDSKLPYDFTFNTTQTGQGGLLLEVVSNGYLYSRSVTEAVLDTYTRLLCGFCYEPTMKIKDTMPYCSAQIEQALRLGQGPSTRHPWPDTITEQFLQICTNSPQSLAIQDEYGCITYQELSMRVNSISWALISAGAGQDTCIAILCEPSIDTYAAMLAILSIGAVYFPLDASLPMQRQQSMIGIAKPSVLLFHSETRSLVAQYKENSPSYTIDLSTVRKHSEHPLATYANGKLLLFTSGSTGTPKGIMLKQSGLMNYAASKSAHLGIGPIKILQQSSISFDMSVAQAFNAFANGGALVVVPTRLRGDPQAIARLMVEERVELTIATPSEYLMLTYASDILRQCASWRHA